MGEIEPFAEHVAGILSELVAPAHDGGGNIELPDFRCKHNNVTGPVKSGIFVFPSAY